MARICFVLFFLLGSVLTTVFSINEELIAKLDSTIAVTKSATDGIFKEWQVEQYPNFLKSCFMQKVSWEIMRLKYQKKVMESFRSTAGAPPVNFVISFTGRYGTVYCRVMVANTNFSSNNYYICSTAL